MRKMRTKFLSIVLVFAAVFTLISGTVQAANADTISTISVTLDGNTLTFDQDPIMKNDRVMVPFRGILETLGYTVTWSKYSTQVALAENGDKYISVCFGESDIEYNNGVTSGIYVCDVIPQIISNRLLVPIRAISECAGCHVEWDDYTQTVIITTDDAQASVFESSSTKDNKTFSINANSRNIYQNSNGIYVDGNLIDSNAYWKFISDGHTLYYSYNGNVYRVNLDSSSLEKEFVLYCEDVFLWDCYNNQYLYYGRYNKYDEIIMDLVIYDLKNANEVMVVEDVGNIELSDKYLFVEPNTGSIGKLSVRQMDLNGDNCKTIITDAFEMEAIDDKLYYEAIEYTSNGYSSSVKCYDVNTGVVTILTESYTNAYVTNITSTYATFSIGGSDTFDVYY